MMPRPASERAGGPRAFETAEAFEAACAAYIEHAEPDTIERVESFKGARAAISMKRIPTWAGFASFIGVARCTISDWRNPNGQHHRPEYADALDMVETFIERVTLEEAFCGNANAVLGARFLGIADKQAIHSTVTATVAPRPATDPDDMPEHLHPDMPEDELQHLLDDGKQPLRYSRRQLNAGIPYLPAPK